MDDPDTVATPQGAVESAVAFWTAHKLNELADADETKAITEIVNGGASGFVERAFIKQHAYRMLAT